MNIFVTGAAAVCDATRVRFASLPEVSDFRFLNVNFVYYLFFSVICRKPPIREQAIAVLTGL